MDIKNAILNDLSDAKKYLLLLLSDKHAQPINGKLWYQKELFLISKNNQKLYDELEFEAYLFGPFSELAESEMDELVQLKVVKRIGNSYALTDLGKAISKEISTSASKSELDLIREVKDLLNDLDKDELLLFIYITFPDMCEDSIELKNLIKKRRQIAISLYKKEKVSIGKAAEIAGMSISAFTKELPKFRG